MIEIIHRYNVAVLYSSASAADIRAATEEAAKQGADLRGAYLIGAYLEGAHLEGANLIGVNLIGANLRGANLIGANLIGVKGITPKVLQILGSRHPVIVRSYGHITIGCHYKPLGWWEEHYRAIGRTEGYSDIEVEEYGEHIAACRRFMERYSLMVDPQEQTEATNA